MHTGILASVSFWPLFIIESVARVSQHMLSHTTCSLNRYNVKGELDCFNCKTGFFSDYLRQCLQKTAITIHVFAKENQLVYGEYLTIIRKVSVPEYTLRH